MNRKRNVLVTLGWYDPRIIEGIGRFAQEAGWHLEMRAMIEGSPPPNWRGDGMLVNDTEVPKMGRFIRAQIEKQPTVLIGANHRYTHLASVQEDNLECGRLAAVHFVERGYEHFGWVSLQRGLVQEDRRNGFVAALEAAGRSCALMEWSLERTFRADSWENRRAWLGRRLSELQKPLGLFVLDDILAIETVEVCFDLGLRVPEDVAVIGVGNMELVCECARVPISSVDENITEISYRAASLLNDLMAGCTVPSKPVLVPVKGLMLRKSADCLAVAHPAVLRALAFMNNSFAKPVSVEDVAAAAGVSVRALQYAFRSELRRSPARHLMRIRLDRAMAMLTQSEAKMSSIAESCGFATVRNFHRCFVREYGKAPRSFRKKKSRSKA